MSTTVSVLEVDGLVAGYSGTPVVQGVSLRCQGGQVVALLGANGAGKSTCLKAIMGLVRPRAGTVTIDGISLGGLDAPKITRSGVVMVPEGRSLFSGMTVSENLLVGAYIHRRSKARITEDLEHVFSLFPVLGSMSRRDVATLSGGEQQMVAIGRALMGRPKALLLDEPSLGLAPIVFQALLREVVNLRETGTAVLLVEQNARVTLQYADFAYVLERGRVIAEGVAADIRNNEIIEAGYLGARPPSAACP